MATFFRHFQTNPLNPKPPFLLIIMSSKAPGDPSEEVDPQLLMVVCISLLSFVSLFPDTILSDNSPLFFSLSFSLLSSFLSLCRRPKCSTRCSHSSNVSHRPSSTLISFSARSSFSFHFTPHHHLLPSFLDPLFFSSFLIHLRR